MTEQKIKAIEEKLAYQEQHVDDLSQMVSDQWGQIEALKKQIKNMTDKIERLEAMEDNDHRDGAGDGAGDGDRLSLIEQAIRDKPPHY
jgi:uncharacterized coiled-coil protein SlyX